MSKGGMCTLLVEGRRTMMPKGLEMSPAMLDQGAQAFQESTWIHCDEAHEECQSE